MNPRQNRSRNRMAAGWLLVEAVTYFAIVVMVTAAGSAAFYLCWDHSKALISAGDDIAAALSAGERWRADVRGATGDISIEAAPSGQVMKIPEGEREIVYSFDSAQVLRQTEPSAFPVPLLRGVKSSEMREETRDGVRAWRWELEVAQRRREMHLPLLFTFEAAEKNQ